VPRLGVECIKIERFSVYSPYILCIFSVFEGGNAGGRERKQGGQKQLTLDRSKQLKGYKPGLNMLEINA
jgi:hypothetical protein